MSNEAEPLTQSSRWRTVARLLGQYRLHVGVLVASAFIVGVVEAAFLVAATRTGLAIANNVGTVELTRGVTLSVNEALVLAGALIAIRLGVALLDVRVQLGLSYRVTTSLRKQLARAFLDASWSVQRAQPAGALQQVVVTFPNNAATLLYSLTSAAGAALSLSALILIALLVDPTATLVVVAALVVLSAVLGPLRRRVLARSQTYVADQVNFSNGVAEVGALGLEIQSYGVATQVADNLKRLIERNAASQRRLGLLTSSISPVYVSLAYAAIIGALATVTALGTSNLGSVGAVMLVMLRSMGYGQQLQNGSSAMSQITPFISEVDLTLSNFRSHARRWGHVQPSQVTPLELKDVSFGYSAQRRVVDRLSLRLEKGELVGIVGPSGTGKSTLVELMLGLRTPDHGQILAGGHLLTDIDLDAWTSAVAFVPQIPNLITGTVAENIRFFRDGISQEQLVDAAKAAHIWDEVQLLPNGLDTHIGERGQQLSGGQRQRLCIARALVGRPQLLVLDEPTSALDATSETAIRNALTELKESTTIIVIAHRSSTLDICGRILLLQEGSLVPKDIQSGSEGYL